MAWNQSQGFRNQSMRVNLHQVPWILHEQHTSETIFEFSWLGTICSKLHYLRTHLDPSLITMHESMAHQLLSRVRLTQSHVSTADEKCGLPMQGMHPVKGFTDIWCKTSQSRQDVGDGDGDSDGRLGVRHACKCWDCIRGGGSVAQAKWRSEACRCLEPRSV